MTMLETLCSGGFIINDAGELIPIIAIGGGMLIGLVAIVTGAISCAIRSGQTERTRREIAAYVAEGSIPPEEGERMMKLAGKAPKA